MKVHALFICVLGSCSLYSYLPEITYIFEPVLTQDAAYLSINVTYKTGQSDTTIFDVPNEWALEKDYLNQIKNLSIRISDKEFEPQLSEEVICKHDCQEVIQLSYELHQDVRDSFRFYRAIINESFIHFMSSSALIFPKFESEHQNIKLTVLWQNIAENCNVACTFGAGYNVSCITTLYALKNSLFIAGSFRQYDFKIKENNLTLAIFGNFQVNDTKILDCLNSIITAQRDFFNDHEFEYYLVSLISVENCSTPKGGHALGNSFSAYMANHEPLKTLAVIFAHENFHTWIGYKTQTLNDGTFYWFTEGFTEYYGLTFALCENFITLKDYITIFNRILRRYYTSYKQSASNEEISRDFHNDNEVRLMPYWRGFIFAILVDYKLRKISNNTQCLDDIMQAVMQLIQTSENPLSTEKLFEILRSYLPEALQDIDVYINQRKRFTLPEDLFGCDISCNYLELGSFDYCFDVETSHPQKVIFGVDKTKKAYASGLRNGQKAISWQIKHDPLMQSEIVLEDKTIKYFATDNQKIQVPQYYFNNFNPSSKDALS